MRYKLILHLIDGDILEVPCKTARETASWIDGTVRRAVLVDNASKKRTVIKSC